MEDEKVDNSKSGSDEKAKYDDLIISVLQALM